MSDALASPLLDVATTAPDASSLSADHQLQRVIGPMGVAANSINSAIGGGIFVMPGLVAAILGPAAILAYVLCGIAVALILTCFAEIGSVVHRSGGSVAYIEEAFGPLAGFLAWVIYALGFTAVACAAIANVLLDAVATVLPGLSHGLPRIFAMFLLFGALAAINIRGVKHGIRLSLITTTAKLLPLFFLILVGVAFIHPINLHWTGIPSVTKLGESSLLVFFAYQGAEESLGPSAEIRDPRRTVPLAIFYATFVLILLYVSLQLVSQGVLGAQLGQNTSTPLASVAASIAGPSARALLLIAASVSIFGSMASAMVCSPRSYFLMAQNGMLPSVLARVHPRFRTPHMSIAFTAAVMFFLAATGAFRHLAILSVASGLCIYLTVCLGALRFRYTRPHEPGAFRAPGGPTVALLGCAAILWLFTSVTRREFAILAATLLASTAYFLLLRHVRSRSAQPA